MGFIWILIIAFLFLCVWNIVKVGSESDRRYQEIMQKKMNAGMEFSEEIMDDKIIKKQEKKQEVNFIKGMNNENNEVCKKND